jgi:hypothetical protein
MSKTSRLFLEEQERRGDFNSYLDDAYQKAVSKEKISIKFELEKLFESWGEIYGKKNFTKNKSDDSKNI